MDRITDQIVRIAKIVAKEWGVDEAHLWAQCRHEPIATARHSWVAACHQLLGLSHASMNRRLGGRVRSTISCSLKTHAALMASHPRYAEHYRRILDACDPFNAATCAETIKWVSVDCELPDDEMTVLVHISGEDEPAAGFRSAGHWVITSYRRTSPANVRWWANWPVGPRATDQLPVRDGAQAA